MADEQRRSFRQRLAAIVIAGIGTAAASVFSYAAAIYEAANPEPMRELSPGETVDTGRWHVAITGARFSSVPPTGVKPYEPKTTSWSMSVSTIVPRRQPMHREGSSPSIRQIRR